MAQDGNQGSDRDSPEGKRKHTRAKGSKRPHEALKKTLMMPSIRPEQPTSSTPKAESAKEPATAPFGTKTSVQPFTVPPNKDGEKTVTEPAMPPPDAAPVKTSIRGTDPAGSRTENAPSQRPRGRHGPLDTGTIVGMPKVSPDELKQAAAGSDRAARKDTRPVARGDVTALPPTQAIGPAPATSASERVRHERVTDPEPRGAVIDTDGETVASSSEHVPTGADRRDVSIGTSRAPAPTTDESGSADRRGPEGQHPSHRPGRRGQDLVEEHRTGVPDLSARDEDRTDSGGADTVRVGRLKLGQRVRDTALVVGLMACVAFVALYEGDPPVDAEEDAQEAPGAVQPLPPPTKTQGPPARAAEVPVGPTTKLVTVPAGAEILHSGAIVASTPATLPRPQFASEYLIRKRGYVPQLVRIAPSSPPVIELELKPSMGPGEGAQGATAVPTGAGPSPTTGASP
ncbi:MAG: hypothetical protein OXU20_37475 [Myxococcales bacterium]|nr:hypothetical protein [Myxococcales bacterium]